MTQKSMRRMAIAISTFACAALLSFTWSEQRGVLLSVESAQARVGRPLTPVSVAGVARRQTRRLVLQAPRRSERQPLSLPHLIMEEGITLVGLTSVRGTTRVVLTHPSAAMPHRTTQHATASLVGPVPW